ncbi:MAG: PQQ-binding-like beta-propeller repeat protein, partial [Planctomycetota bacterium]|nr:PQQ-binding-like beta-propeller repeat protein [Planctomycetota bacterium]
RRALADDWPMYLGPEMNSISKETGLADSWPAKGPREIWRIRLGDSFSPPAAKGNDLIVTHRIGFEEIVDCLDTKTGKLRWRFKYPTRYRDMYGYNSGPRCSPIITEKEVYTLGAGGEFHCLVRQTGKQIWKRSINREYKVKQNFFGVGASPVLEGNLLLANVGGPDGAGVAAFDRLTGKTVWATTNDGASYCTPAVATVKGKRYGFFLTRKGLVITEVATGKVHSTYFFRSRKYESVNGATPIIVDDLVFLSAAYQTGCALLRMKDDGVEEIYRGLQMSNHWGTSIYIDGHLYGVDGRHESEANFRCIDFKSGKLKWQVDEELGRATMIVADGKFFILTERGKLVLAKASPEAYKEISRTPTILSYPCYTPPILANGFLYARDERKLICFDVRK